MSGWPELDGASAEIRSLLRRIDHPRASARHRRELCTQALALVGPQGRPRLWSLLQIELGSDWIEDPAADPIEKMERAVLAYETALAVPDIPAETSAAAHSNLGFCYLHRLRGLRGRNLGTAIAHLESALARIDPAEDTELWASTSAYLAEAREARARGAADVAARLREIGAIFLERAQGERAHNLEVALRLLRRALRVHVPATEDDERASAWNNLGTACMHRLRGDRAENVERAIEAYGKALGIRTRESSPVPWAEAQTNLGNALSQRVLGDAADNGERAIAAYRRALEVFQRRKTPRQWARTTLNLGNALHERRRGDRAATLEAAIACYRGVLRVFSRQDDPFEWATAQDNLGLAYADRRRGNSRRNLAQALAAHRAALPVWARLGARWEWARTRNSLGTIFTEPPGGGPPDRQRAAREFGAALRVFSLELAPDQHRRTQRNLGDLWFAARRWNAAQTAYAGALRASDVLFQSGATPASRDAELRESLDLPIRAAYCLAQQERAAAAMTVLEQGRTRTLADALDRREAALDRLPPAARQAFVRTRDEVRRLEARARSLDVDDDELLGVSEALGAARKELARQVSAVASGVLPAPVDEAELRALVDRLGVPLVYLLTTTHGSLALILPPSASPHVLALDGFTSRHAAEIEIGGEGKRDETMRALDAAWPIWREHLMLPLARRLRRLGFDAAVLIPCGRLALWPLPATVTDHLRLAVAPSARLLSTAVANAEMRRGLPPSLLAVAHSGPGGRFLPSAEIEAERVAQCLGQARLLRGTEATRDAVARALPGATHLHFACHGSFDGGAPLDSALELAGPEPLSLRDLLDGDLDLASARLVVLSACDSGRIEHRYLADEALGFPAGLLQAGVPAVVSSLWEVDDLAARFLLADFYTAHVRGGLPVLDALFAAQERLRTATHRDLGLAEHCREVLSRPLPADLRAALYLRLRRAESHPNEVPFRHPFYWAPFVVSGWARGFRESVRIGGELADLAAMLSAPVSARVREGRVQIFRQALLACRTERPKLWAAIQVSLAKDLLEDRSPSRAASLEEAIEGLAGAVETFLATGLSIPWAEACTVQACAYLDRIRGSRRDNVEIAIGLCRKALQVQTRRARPAFWAEAADCLAAALAVRHPRTIYLEKSIALYRQVLQVRQQEADDAAGWANTATNLAKALGERIRGDRAEDLEEAIKLLQEAEQIFAETEPASRRWVTIQINLAGLYLQRLRDDPTANREKAIGILLALLARRPEVQPLDRARALHHLGALYLERGRGPRARSLEKAIECYRETLTITTRQDLPQNWSETTQNLATVYAERLLGEPARNLEQAISLYREVLAQLDPKESPEDWATAASNLATAVSDRLIGDPGENLQESVSRYRQVLEIRRRDADPRGWALTQMNLGNALARLDSAGEAGAFAAAQAAYGQALEVHQLSSLPSEHRRTQGNLADLLFGRQRWREALVAYRAALAAGDAVYESAATPEARRAALRANLDFSTRAAYCLVRIGQPSEAAVLLERHRTRSLNEALGPADALLHRLPEPVRTALISTRERIASLEAQSLRLGLGELREFLRITGELSQHRSTLAAVLEHARQIDADFLMYGTTPASFRSLVSQLGVPLVYLFTTAHGSVGLLVRTAGSPAGEAESESLFLDGFQAEHLRSLLHGVSGESSYLSLVVHAETRTLQKALDRLVPILQEHLIFPLAEQLVQRGISRAGLVACGSLGLLPLTALAPEGLLLHLSPSAKALASVTLKLREKEDAPPRLLAVGNPVSRSRPLAFAALEAQEISCFFPPDRRQVLLGSLATLATIRERIPEATHLQLSCHGQFLLDQPLESSLELSGGEPLRLRDLFGPHLDLTSVRLVVLSACQTGITDQELPDEALGFPAVFLQAGVPATMSTLWPVPDASTALLLIRFYQYHVQDLMEPAVALCRAQRWLRQATVGELGLVAHCERILQETRGAHPLAYHWLRRFRRRPEEIPFDHPYFWAGFVVTGL